MKLHQRDRSLYMLRGEVAELFGVNTRTVSRWRETGKIPAIREGCHWYFPRPEILAIYHEEC